MEELTMEALLIFQISLIGFGIFVCFYYFFNQLYLMADKQDEANKLLREISNKLNARIS